MATKKQKREAAEAKRAAFEAQVKADGLKALEADRARRAEKDREFKKKTAAPKMMGMHRAAVLAVADEFEGLPLNRRIEALMAISPEIRKIVSDTPAESLEREVLERFAVSLKEHLDAADEAILAPLTMGIGGPKIGMAELKADGDNITMEAYLQTDLKLTSELFRLKPGDVSIESPRKFYKVRDEVYRKQDEELIRLDIEENFEPDFGDFLG